MTAGKTYKPFLDLLTEGRELPAGFDTWGFKITRPDLRTYAREDFPGGRFRWPFPSPDGRPPPVLSDPAAVADGNPCPTEKTGGFCVAKTLCGARDGGYGHAAILLLAYNAADVLGESAEKLRVPRVAVVDLVDGRSVYQGAAGADLTGADLAGADLTVADLAGANLTRADLTRAYLADADLTGADLTGANLTRAYLADADLTVADLTGADLTGANLTVADLTGADLTGAYLTGANLAVAYLTGADLTGADLTRAYLAGADLTGADLTRARGLDKAIGYQPAKAATDG